MQEATRAMNDLAAQSQELERLVQELRSAST